MADCSGVVCTVAVVIEPLPSDLLMQQLQGFIHYVLLEGIN